MKVGILICDRYRTGQSALAASLRQLVLLLGGIGTIVVLRAVVA